MRDVIVLRAVIAWKLAKGVLFAFVAVGLALPGQGPLRWLNEIGGRLSSGAHYLQPLGALLSRHPSEAHIVETAVLAAAAAAVVFTEAIGLHYRRRWAAWLTVIATSALIPLELYQLFHKFRAGAVAVLAVNLLIVFYLARLARRHASLWLA